MFGPLYSERAFVIWTLFGLVSVFLLAALLKLEITVSFLWLSLPVHSGSLKRIKYSKLYSLAHTLLLKVVSALNQFCATGPFYRPFHVGVIRSENFNKMDENIYGK